MDKIIEEEELATPGSPQEYFVYLLESSCKRATYVGATVNLDRRLRPICRRQLTVGNDAHTVVDARQILKIAVEVGASALVLAHNHPSGDPEPSFEDVQVTIAVAAAAEVIGVSFLDHLVVGGGRWVSLAARGIPELRQRAPVPAMVCAPPFFQR